MLWPMTQPKDNVKKKKKSFLIPLSQSTQSYEYFPPGRKPD